MQRVFIGGEFELLEAEIDLQSGALSIGRRHNIGKVPSFLAFAPDRKALLAVIEGGDELALLKWSPAGLALCQKLPCPGGPAHVSVIAGERLVTTASYGSGETHCYRFADDGTLEGPLGTLRSGKFSHCTTESPDGQLVVTSKGDDHLSLITCDAQLGSLRELERVSAPEGSGPRHLCFSSDGKHAYLACENDCTLISYAVKTNESPRLLQSGVVSTLPRSFQKGDSGADLHLSPDNRFIYVSNRGHDSIAIFSLGERGPELVGHEDTRGQVPRNFCLLGEDHLLVANQESGSLTLFSRSRESGRLAFIGSAEVGQRAFWVGASPFSSAELCRPSPPLS